MRFAEIWLVVGTRPEAIKLSPVARALIAQGIDCTLVLTGQHAGLDPAEHGLGQLPALRLNCPGEPSPYAHAGKVEAKMRALLSRGPAMIVVQGDTSSAYASASAAFTAGVPVAHVEAGLRTYDSKSPWPEEEFRTAIDARAVLLFAPTDHAAGNLERERIEGDVHVTGNSGIDALLETLARLPPPVARDNGKRRILVTCHRRESWGEGLIEIGTAIAALADRGDVAIDVVLHPNPSVAQPLTDRLGGHDAVTLHAPLSHSGLLELMRSAALILSDSGGIQEEAPALGVPLLVLREKTERPEGVASGNSRLVGVTAERIIAEAGVLLDDPAALAGLAKRAMPFGDGRSATRIAAIIRDWLKSRGRPKHRFG